VYHISGISPEQFHAETSQCVQQNRLFPRNRLYYGDNLDILRRKVREETVDLCYIDPPFNSKRTYHQIYNNIGREDLAQEQAFIDSWTWDDLANAGYLESSRMVGFVLRPSS
jgi:hypothetical protein